MNKFNYAKPEAFKWQTFDRKTLQFTTLPARKPSPPPGEEPVVPPAVETLEKVDEPADDSPAGDVAGEHSSFIEFCFNGS